MERRRGDRLLNYRIITYLIILAFVLIGVCYLIQPVSAAPRISQGEVIYLNETYDISGVTGWDSRIGNPNQLEYCGGFSCYYESNPYLLTLPPRTRVPGSESQYNYWINPEIFATRTGDWYQHEEHLVNERAGNTIAFIVKGAYKNTTATYPNGTVINQSEFQSEYTTGITVPKPSILPEQKISDYLLARGDAIAFNDNTSENIWIHGRINSLYGEGINTTFPGNSTATLEAGTYSLIKQYPGKNSEFDVRRTSDLIQWRYQWEPPRTTNIMGIQPRLVKEMLIEALKQTDDTYKEYRLEVQDPSISVVQFDEVPMQANYSRYQEYHLSENGYVSLFDVRGYTNLKEGTPISLVLDPNKHYPRDIRGYTFNTTAQRTSLSNMSYYQVFVPIIWDQMVIGMHTMKVSTELGASINVDFPISVLPADSFRPNATVKYAGDSNPWKPNLTIPDPIVITKQVVVERTIEIPVTPSQESIQEAQAVTIKGYVEQLVIGCAIFIVFALVIGYLVSVIKRARMKP